MNKNVLLVVVLAVVVLAGVAYVARNGGLETGKARPTDNFLPHVQVEENGLREAVVEFESNVIESALTITPDRTTIPPGGSVIFTVERNGNNPGRGLTFNLNPQFGTATVRSGCFFFCRGQATITYRAPSSLPQGQTGVDVTLTATQGGESVDARVRVGAPPPVNVAPSVNAGPNQTITLPSIATMNGAVSDDGLPNPPGQVSIVWSKVSGPGNIHFSYPNEPSGVDYQHPVVSFSAAGTYVLRLEASDSALSSRDDITVTVQQAEAPLTIEFLEPQAGARVFGTVNVRSRVSDGSRVTASGLRIREVETGRAGSIGGSRQGTNDFVYRWNTGSYSGPVDLEAVAYVRGAGGAATEGARVNINVFVETGFYHIVPSSAALQPGQTQQFTFYDQGQRNLTNEAAWSITCNAPNSTQQNSRCGAITPGGLYTAPSQPYAPNVGYTLHVNVSARLLQEGTAATPASVSIPFETPVSLLITPPGPVPVQLGGTVRFRIIGSDGVDYTSSHVQRWNLWGLFRNQNDPTIYHVVSGTSDQDLGSIAADGTYTAPSRIGNFYFDPIVFITAYLQGGGALGSSVRLTQ